MAPDPIMNNKIPAPVSLLDAETTSLPPTTRNALLAHLQDSTTIPRLNSVLTDALARSGWTERVNELALELLRNGECANFGELLGEVTRRTTQGTSATNGSANGRGGDHDVDVRIPQEVIERSVKFLKEEVESVIEVVHDEKTGASTNGVNGHKAK